MLALSDRNRELVERILGGPLVYVDLNKVAEINHLLDAARAESRSEAEAKLLEALEPFAATGAVIDAKPKDDACWAGQRPAPPITFGHLRRAAEVYASLSGEGRDA